MPTSVRLCNSHHLCISRLVTGLVLLLLAGLSGCSARAPHPDTMAPQAHLPEQKIQRLLRVWQQQLEQYIVREGNGDPAVVSQMRVARSRDVLRPARITFSALDVDASTPSRDGWDLEGVLIGKQTSGTRNWYVFLVGLVAREGYRPSSLDDVRVLGLSSHESKFSWEASTPNMQAVQRYRAAYGASVPVRFPGDTDWFRMTGAQDCVRVVEARSQSQWSLLLDSGKPGARAGPNACAALESSL